MFQGDAIPAANQSLINYIGSYLNVRAGVLDNFVKDPENFTAMQLRLHNKGQVTITKATWKIYFNWWVFNVLWVKFSEDNKLKCFFFVVVVFCCCCFFFVVFFFFFFFPENRIRHFMQIVSDGYDLYKMSNSVFWRKLKNKNKKKNMTNLSFAELAKSVVFWRKNVHNTA